MFDSDTFKSEIEQMSKELGFASVGFATPTGHEDAAKHFQNFLDNSYHGDMAWLEAKADRRKSPKVLWPDVNSIIMLSMNYGPGKNPLDDLIHKNIGNISVYAKGKDYHDVIKKRLKQIARHIHRNYNAEVKVFVDTAPVMEKPLGQKAGIGWQGKHTNLVSRDFGSWTFLGAIFTSLEIEQDDEEQDHCGSCSACLDVCPTNAFPSPYTLDARRCISYLTIEFKGHIDREFREAMGNRIYGCDDCLAICPWNKYAKLTDERQFHPRIELDPAKLDDLALLDDESFRAVFSGSPIKRIGRNYFIRNVLIAMGNSGNSTYIEILIDKLKEESPHVRAMAVWALGRLCSEGKFKALKEAHQQYETDTNVIKEWLVEITD